MHGDFSVLYFDPYEHKRGVAPGRNGVLRNVNGVLHQQGRVTLDADLTDGELLELAWQGQAGRDVIGAGIAAVPATEPDGFKVDAAFVDGADVHLRVRPGRAWVDGILTRLAGDAANPTAAVERIATYFGPPLTDPAPTPASIDEGVRDAVILEISEEALHGFQYPERLIEAALGGPDTAERSFVNIRFRLLRLGQDEDCNTIRGKLVDDPASKGKLGVTLAPAVVIAGDCPVVGGGGYTGFEHFLYRIEIAETNGAARFKWSQWNGGLAGRGRFDATVTPAKVVIDAGRAAIVNSGLAEFYLEALQYDDLAGHWRVIYGAAATLNNDHDLELATPPSFGALPSTTDPVFFRLWNGLEEIADFTNAGTPQELRDGIRLVFDAPAAGNYRPGDYWTFPVRAGEIPNPPVLIDTKPPTGIAYHRVALAEITWTSRKNTTVDGAIEDCRQPFRPLTNQKVCCTFLIGNGVTSFGDFNSLEEAAAHLPPGGGELCLLPGFHRANLVLDGRRNVTIHGCEGRSFVVPRAGANGAPIISLVDCVGVHIYNVDLLTFDGTAVVIEGRQEGSCDDVHIHDTRMIARVHAIRATNAAGLNIARNRLHLLDTLEGLTTISVAADDTLIERNTVVMIPFVPRPPGDPNGSGGDDPADDPADPCAEPDILLARPTLVLAYAVKVWTLALAVLNPKQPYRGIGGIHVRAGSERVRILENVVAGGAGNGITLGGDLDPPPPPDPIVILRAPLAATATLTAKSSRSLASDVTSVPRPTASVTVGKNGQFLALVQNEAAKPVADVDVFLEGSMTASDRSDAQGMVSIRATPGPYTLDVSPAFQVVKVAETREDGVLVNVVTIAPRAGTATKRGFLHEITIEANNVSFMGLSGIGFVPKAEASLNTTTTLSIPANDPRGALLAFADALVLQLGLAPLLRSTDPVRDLVIIGNRLHHNLQNPFTDQLRLEAQAIGRGGISLGVVDSAVISGNHVNENGVRAIDPICGVFVGSGDNLEITDNVVSGNGLVTDDFEQNRQGGIRGGVYIRFAGALTSQSSRSSGHRPALRVHDNRIDSPAGRALTVFAFGPISCANNHLNSEHSGRFQFLDTLVGGVVILNLGGIHRLLSRNVGSFVGSADGFSAAAELSLPGGETLIDDNYVRLGSVNQSSISQLVLALDDVGYSANQSSVFRREPFLANVALFGDTVRATAGRYREDALQTISLLTSAFRMNITALNQADHCIVARPAPVSGNVLPTIAADNQVLDAVACARLFAPGTGLGPFISQSLAANANELGGTLPADAFTAADVQTLSRQFVAKSLTMVNDTHAAKTKVYQFEAARLSDKVGADNPRVTALKAQADAGARVVRLVAMSTEAATVQPPSSTATTAAVSGRFVNEKGQGLGGYQVELVRADGSCATNLGRTDAAGFYGSAFDEYTTAALAKEGALYLRFADEAGKEVFRARETIAIKPGADIRSTVTVPVRIVSKSAVSSGTVNVNRPKASRSEPSPAGRPRPRTTATPTPPTSGGTTPAKDGADTPPDAGQPTRPGKARARKGKKPQG